MLCPLKKFKSSSNSIAMSARTGSYTVSQFDAANFNHNENGKTKIESTAKRKGKGKMDLSDLKRDMVLDHHKISAEELCRRFYTHPDNGLSHRKAKENLVEYGPNSLTPPKSTPEWIKFVKNLVGGFAMLLWAASSLCLIAYGMQWYQIGDWPAADNLYLGIVLGGVVVLTAMFTYYQVQSIYFVLKSS